jgi:hypothetical protein
MHVTACKSEHRSLCADPRGRTIDSLHRLLPQTPPTHAAALTSDIRVLYSGLSMAAHARATLGGSASRILAEAAATSAGTLINHCYTVCTLINHWYTVCTLINHCYTVCTLINHWYTVCTLINHWYTVCGHLCSQRRSGSEWAHHHHRASGVCLCTRCI